MKAHKNIPIKLTCIVFLRLAEDYSQAGKYMKAANLVFAVIQAIEPGIPEEYVQGYTFDGLVFKAFDFLTVMVRGMKDMEVLKELHLRTLEIFEGRKEHAYYEDHFEALLKVIEKQIAY
jgi:hypothetical protein